MGEKGIEGSFEGNISGFTVVPFPLYSLEDVWGEESKKGSEINKWVYLVLFILLGLAILLGVMIGYSIWGI